MRDEPAGAELARSARKEEGRELMPHLVSGIAFISRLAIRARLGMETGRTDPAQTGAILPAALFCLRDRFSPGSGNQILGRVIEAAVARHKVGFCQKPGAVCFQSERDHTFSIPRLGGRSRQAMEALLEELGE